MSTSSGGEGVVGPHRGRAHVEVRHAGGAVAQLARERRLQAAAPRRLEERVARLVRNGVGALLEPDRDRLGRRVVVDGGDVAGHDEALDETLLGRDVEHREAGLDGVHVGAGAADVEVGVGALADQGRATGGVEEAAFGVEVVMDRQPFAGRGP